MKYIKKKKERKRKERKVYFEVTSGLAQKTVLNEVVNSPVYTFEYVHIRYNM